MIKPSPTHLYWLLSTSGVQNPDFGIQSGRILGIFWIWIGYRFHFNRIRIIQMK